MVGHRQDVIGVGIAGYLPGLFAVACAVTVQANMLRVFVRRRVDDNVIKPQIPAGLHDANGNFAPVGDEDFIVHYGPVLPFKLPECDLSHL
jgi:hypothetical protein